MSSEQSTALNAFLANVEKSVGVGSTLARPPPLPSKVVPTSTRAPAFDIPMEAPVEAPSSDFDIPMEEPVEAPVTPPASKQIGRPKRDREPHVLVIDPEGTLDSRLFETLKNQDIRTTWPGTLSEIGSILQNDPPGGVVLAAGLGGVSPQQVIGALRPYIGGQAPIIVLGSGKPNQEIRSVQQAVAAGASHFFSLPTNNAYVAVKLRRMMDAAVPTVEAPEAAEPSGVAGLPEVKAPAGRGPSAPEAVEDEPLAPAPEEVEEAAEPPASVEPAPEAKVHTVLIVDPKQTLGKNISESFKAQGLKTVVVADPDEVGNAITGTQAHAVIVATDLGGESAEQAIKVIRANPRGSILPVFLAGTGGKNQRIRSPRDARRVGADFMFSLPSHIPYVARQVKKWVTKGSSIPPDEAEEKPKVTPDEIAEIQRAIDVLTTRAAQLIKKAMKARKEGRKDEANRIFAKVREQSAQISQLEEELARLTAAAESADEPEKLEFLQPPSESGSTQYMFTNPRSKRITEKRRKRRQR
jgi:DNA-binding response OmpR family regulator